MRSKYYPSLDGMRALHCPARDRSNALSLCSRRVRGSGQSPGSGSSVVRLGAVGRKPDWVSHWEQSDLWRGQSPYRVEGQSPRKLAEKFCYNLLQQIELCGKTCYYEDVAGFFCIAKFDVKGACDMAHVMKMTKAACGHMFKHYERAKDENGEYVKFGNESIDPKRTPMNYNLAPDRELSQGDFIRKRCGEVYCMNRKDVNVLCSWVVTVPKDVPEAEYERFFHATYDFLEKRYGRENVVSAYVHMDEVTPHMHFAFVPVVYDRKKEKYKVSAFEVLDRKELKVFHPELEKHLESVLGHEVGILNEATKEGNKSIAELKRGTAQAELQKTTLETREMLSKAQELKQAMKVAQEQKKSLEGKIEGLQRDLLTAEQVKYVPHTKALIGDKQVIATEDFNALCKTASTAEALLKEIEPARKINARAKEIISQAQEQADTIIDSAKRESLQTVIERERRVSDLEKKLTAIEERLSKALSLLPERIKSEFLSAWEKASPKEKSRKHTRNFDQER